MAKGQLAKKAIAQKILEVFEGSFLYNNDKEIRIRTEEDGQEVQIKVTLTAAKDNVEPGDDVALPGTTGTSVVASTVATTTAKETIQPTEEEKQKVKDLLAAIGM